MGYTKYGYVLKLKQGTRGFSADFHFNYQGSIFARNQEVYGIHN